MSQKWENQFYMEAKIKNTRAWWWWIICSKRHAEGVYVMCLCEWVSEPNKHTHANNEPENELIITSTLNA